MRLLAPQNFPVALRRVRNLRPLAVLVSGCLLAQATVHAAGEAPAAAVTKEPAESAQTGIIEGRVFNAASGMYVNNARVTVEGTSLQAFTNDFGEYRLRGVPAGSVHLKVNYTGQRTLETTVVVEGGAAARANFSFNSDKPTADPETIVLDPYVVEARRLNNALELATNEERVSTTIKSVVALDSLGYVSDGNIGEFVRFLPGVDVANGSVSGNANNPDSAMTVSVRGFGADSTAILVDGMPIASGSPENLTRTVQLDGVSINNASRVEIIKVATPDMPQDSPGGVVNLVTRGAFELANASYDLSVAFNGNTNSPVFKRTPGPYGPSFKTLPSVRLSVSVPLSKKLGLSFSVASDDKYSLTRNSSMRDWFLTSRSVVIDGVSTPIANAKGGIRIDNPVVDRSELVENQWLDKRLSGNLRLDWRPVPELEIRANGQVSTMKNTGVYRRTQWRWNTTGAGIQDWGADYVRGRQRTATFNPGDSASMTTDARDKEGFTTSGYVTAKYRHGGWSVDLKATASESYHTLPDAKNGHFSTVDASISPGRLDLQGISEGVIGKILLWDASGAPLDYGNLSAWNPILNSGFQARTSEYRSRDLVKQYNADITRELDFLPFPVTAKFGGMQRSKSAHKWGKGTSYRWNYVGPTTGIPSNSELQSDYATTAEYGYATPQYWADPSKIYRFYQAHPDYFSDTFISPTTNVNLPANNYLSRVGTAKGLTLTDTDWYVMFTARLLRNRLTIITGARQSSKDTVGYNTFNDPTYQYVKLVDGTMYRDSIYPSGVRFDGAANAAGKARDVVLTDTALRARMLAAGVRFLPSALELAPNGIANGTRDNNLTLAQFARYTRYIDSSLKQPVTPQINLAYEISKSLRMQLSYSKETRLPDLEGTNGVIVGGASFQINESLTPTSDPGGDGTITIANVKGRPEYNESYNAKLSYYPKNTGGRFSISYYYKVVKKSWQTENSFNTDTDYDDLLAAIGVTRDDYPNYLIQSIIPSGIQQIRKGFEIEMNQDLGALSPWLKGADVFVTYTRRPVTANTGGESRLGWIPQLPVRAKWTGGVSYGRRRFSVQAKWTYLESGITYSGSGTSVTMPDGTTKTVQFYNLNDTPPEVTVQANYQINRRYLAFAVVNRVLSQKVYSQISDTQTGYLPEYASYRTLQDRGISVSAGVRASF